MSLWRLLPGEAVVPVAMHCLVLSRGDRLWGARLADGLGTLTLGIQPCTHGDTAPGTLHARGPGASSVLGWAAFAWGHVPVLAKTSSR